VAALSRRRFLFAAGRIGVLASAASVNAIAAATTAAAAVASSSERMSSVAVRLFLCGDVMTGRGIDQIMPHPSEPQLFERYVKSATGYVAIAEKAGGKIPRAVEPRYVWGDALAELERFRPEVRVVNLETAVTTSADAWPGKGIHYRMHPANVSCLSAAGLDCCVLANNHVLDWGYRGLEETTATLRQTGIRTAGAGADAAQARAPAVIDLPGARRLLVFAYASESAGVPPEWAARPDRAGVNLVDESEPGAVEHVAREVRAVRRSGDLVLVSLHWGGNWGYEVSRAQRELAHRLIDDAGVDLVHGHSSHHPRPIEVHRGRLILYGCGDFLNDYEGIGGYEAFRPDLCLMYFPELDRSGRLVRLSMVTMRIHDFRVNRASPADADWVQKMLDREGRAFGTGVRRTTDTTLDLQWSTAAV